MTHLLASRQDVTTVSEHVAHAGVAMTIQLLVATGVLTDEEIHHWAAKVARRNPPPPPEHTRSRQHGNEV